MVNSILYNNPINLYNSVKDKLEITDFDTDGSVLKASSAVLNAYKLWLTARDYDYINAPDISSIYRLAKTLPISEQTKEVIKSEIYDLTERYFPDIVIVKVEIDFDLNTRTIYIRIDAYEKNVGMSESIYSSIKLEGN